MQRERDERRRSKSTVARRQFLKGGAAAAGLMIAPAFIRGTRGDAWAEGSALFPLGVASGDPDQRSVVLWTRLVENPLTGEGPSDAAIPLAWEIALDPGMRRVIRQGATFALAANGHAVRVLASGLPPCTWLYYRFTGQGRYRGHATRVGRTRTFPGDGPFGGSPVSAQSCRDRDMRFAVVSCQNYAQGFFPAWADIAAQDLDFVVHTGDYIYEDGAGSPVLPGRDHMGAEIFSVADYRNRYALYRLDANLQNAHARLPFILTPDDHEVDNNYAGLDAEESAPYQGDAFVERRRNAYRVYAETMPIRTTVINDDDRLQVFRRLQFGDLADIHVLDTRQFRSDQPAGDGFGSTDTQIDPTTAAILERVFREPLFDAAGILNPQATLMGTRQEAWLALNLLRSRAKWNVVAQQVMLMPWNLRRTGQLFVQFGPDFPGKPQVLGAIGNLANLLNMDAWDGYQAARARLLRMLDHLRPPSPVVLTGDIHSAWGAHLFQDFGDPQNSDVLAVEFVCSSITSTFLSPDPRPTHGIVAAGLPDNPHIRYFNGLFRGYCLCEVDEHTWRTSYRAVGAPADLASADPLELVPREGDPTFTDATATIARDFNRRGDRETLAISGVITGAA